MKRYMYSFSLSHHIGTSNYKFTHLLQEVKDNEAKLQKMKDENKDEYDIRKFEEVLGESHMMIPDSKGRLETAITTLQSVLAEAESTGEPVDETIKADASAVLVEAGAGEESY